MALTIAERFKYNLYLWYFGLTQVRLIHYCRPKIVDMTEEKVVLMMSEPARKGALRRRAECASEKIAYNFNDVTISTFLEMIFFSLQFLRAQNFYFSYFTN